MKLEKCTFGNFISFAMWSDAKKLLDFQIDQKVTNRHYNKLSFYHFEKARKFCNSIGEEGYFNERVKTNFFYALQDEYYALPYFIPKKGLGVRDYYFFSYPMMTLYYAVGLYFVKLSEQLLLSCSSGNIDAFYGGNLAYHSGAIVVNKKNTYYRSFYENFKAKLNNYAKYDANRYVIQLDIQNYFESISIPLLLEKLKNATKFDVAQELVFDEHTREQLEFFFRFIKHGKGGIPQSESNLASSYIGFLYLFFGDGIIEKCIQQVTASVNIVAYKIMRYVDDIYIVIDFATDFSGRERESVVYHLLHLITHRLHDELKLSVNSKTKVYRTGIQNELMEFEHAVGDVSEESVGETPIKSTTSDASVPEKVERLLGFLAHLKTKSLSYGIVSNPQESYKSYSYDDLLNVFDRGVQSCLKSKENQQKLSFLTNDFNFELCRLSPHALMSIFLLQTKSLSEK